MGAQHLFVDICVYRSQVVEWLKDVICCGNCFDMVRREREAHFVRLRLVRTEAKDLEVK